MGFCCGLESMSNSKTSSQYEAADCFRVSKRKKSQKTKRKICRIRKVL